jgi:asparagine synthase (glutamine-hydrolysing)
VALLKEHQDVHTFSIGFEGGDGPAGRETFQLNEAALAAATADRLGTQHHAVLVRAEDYARELPGIVRSQEDPLADPSAPALWFLAREASQFVTVVLSGEGADELFGGYPIYREPLSLAPFNRLPSAARRLLGAVGRGLPAGMRGKSLLERQATPLEGRFVGNARMFSEADKAFLMPEFAARADASTRLTAASYARSRHLDDVTRMQLIDIATWLPGDILMKADKMAMAHSLELRVPFLDRVVFEAARSVPTSLRLSAGTTKQVLRRAAAPILPAELAQRPKLGFPVPYREWLRGPLKPLVDELGSQVDEESGLSPAAVREVLSSGQGVGRSQARRAWTVMIYLLWRREFARSWHAATPEAIEPAVGR